MCLTTVRDVAMGGGLALRFPQRRTINTNRVALVTQPAEHGCNQLVVSKEDVPLIILEIRCYDRCLSAIAFFHQLEEDVRLFGAEIEIAHFVD